MCNFSETAYGHFHTKGGYTKINLRTPITSKKAVWRVMTDLHEKISISFLPVGHTEFSPDPAFGLIKAKYGRSEVANLQDLQFCTTQSRAAHLIRR